MKGRLGPSSLLTLAVVVSFGCLYAYRDQTLPPLAEWLDVGEAPCPVEFVFTLPGDSETRPFVAAAMVNLGLADRAIVVQTDTGPDVDDGLMPPDHEIVHQVLRCRGVPSEKIVVLNGSSASTMDDIQILSDYLAFHPDSRLAVVTSAFHTRRARWTLQQQLGPHFDQITLISAPNPGFDSRIWWRYESGFRLIISEYVKLLSYWLMYGHGVIWCVGGLAAVYGLRQSWIALRARRTDMSTQPTLK